MTERDFAIDVVRRLHEAGYQALWAGGCVRDELLGLTPNDYDVATDARPAEVRKLFRRTVAVGESFGVIEVLGPRIDGQYLSVEVATFRRDKDYVDGRRPVGVEFTDAREDALRRDFTVNGMFFDPLRGELLDYVGGRDDLKARVLRAIGAPELRFGEDRLRMLRAVRIATRFELRVEPATAAAIRVMAPGITVISAERIAKELRELLVHPRRAQGIALLDELGLVEPVLPELLPMQGLPQGPPSAPTGDLWGHTLRVLDLLGPAPSFPLALAALLHDVGKPQTAGRTPDRYTFYGHEHVGARIADALCARLRLSNADRERTVWLVERHQYLADAQGLRSSKLYPILTHPGFGELLALHRADALASGRGLEHVEYCEFLLRDCPLEQLNPPPLLGGHDLTRLGVKPGPVFKRLLDAVREAQLDGTVKAREQAVELVRRLLVEWSASDSGAEHK